MMKVITLHERYSNEIIIIRVDAIIAVQKCIDRATNSEYSCVYTNMAKFNVREYVDVVMAKIRPCDSMSHGRI